MAQTIAELKEARIAAIQAAVRRDCPDITTLPHERQRAAVRRAETDDAVLDIEDRIRALREAEAK